MATDGVACFAAAALPSTGAKAMPDRPATAQPPGRRCRVAASMRA
jgi:hypothetical protein